MSRSWRAVSFNRFSPSLFRPTLTALAATLMWPCSVMADPQVDLAISTLKFGGSLGKLLWVSVAPTTVPTTPEQANAYVVLAGRLTQQVAMGRATSQLLSGTFDIASTATAALATVDPEPFSRGLGMFASWGMKQIGQASTSVVLEETKREARAIVATAIQNSGMSDGQLQNMSAAELGAKLKEFRIGGHALSDVFKDDPKGLQLLTDTGIQLAQEVGVLALSKAEKAADNVAEVQSRVSKLESSLADFCTDVNGRFDLVNSDLRDLKASSDAVKVSLDALERKVGGDEEALRALTQISYSGWTTDQRLQALQSGLISGLSGDQQAALKQNLEDQLKQEKVIAALQNTAQDIGKIAKIANNLNLDPSIMDGLQVAQGVANMALEYASGDLLGAVGSVTGLLGMGGPDPAQVRFEAEMKFLKAEFAQINQKLDQMISLQQQTIQALSTLAAAQLQFRQEVLGQLDRIEATVMRIEAKQEAQIVSESIGSCKDLVNSPTSLNGQLGIPDRHTLASLMDDAYTPGYASGCDKDLQDILRRYVLEANWSGTIVDATSFPQPVVSSNPEMQKVWPVYQTQRQIAQQEALAFLNAALPTLHTSQAALIARLAQPVSSETASRSLQDALSAVDARMQGFKCSESGVLSPALHDLICYGIANQAPKPPVVDRWKTILSQHPLGPQSWSILSLGIIMSQVVDFSTRDSANPDRLVMLSSKELDVTGKDWPSQNVRKALSEHKGTDLLGQLAWLAEAAVLQQSMVSGDYMAQLLEATLYDPVSRALKLDPAAGDQVVPAAVRLMKWSPVLARNVVLLAMRHAIRDSLGGEQQAAAVGYMPTYYALGLGDLRTTGGCNRDPNALDKLIKLLPHWDFRYYISSAKQAQVGWQACPLSYSPTAENKETLPARGEGVGVQLGDFYVLAPTPSALSTGSYEISGDLNSALTWRDRLHQELLDRRLGQVIAEEVAPNKVGDVALRLLNEGWNYKPQSNASAPATKTVIHQ